MKLRLLSSLVVCLLLLSSMAAAEEWVALSDELEIDYASQTLRVFAMDKDRGKLSVQARKSILTFVSSLTDGTDQKKLSDIFKTRKVISAKVQKLIQDNTHDMNKFTRLEDETGTNYFSFDLKLLKSVLPEINLPSPGDAR